MYSNWIKTDFDPTNADDLNMLCDRVRSSMQKANQDYLLCYFSRESYSLSDATIAALKKKVDTFIAHSKEIIARNVGTNDLQLAVKMDCKALESNLKILLNYFSESTLIVAQTDLSLDDFASAFFSWNPTRQIALLEEEANSTFKISADDGLLQYNKS